MRVPKFDFVLGGTGKTIFHTKCHAKLADAARRVVYDLADISHCLSKQKTQTGMADTTDAKNTRVLPSRVPLFRALHAVQLKMRSVE